jgi:RNA recognition motif-containing protein
MRHELYIGNLSAQATEEDLIKLFSICGTVTGVHLIRDVATREFKGCGYVKMSTAAEMRDAIETLNDALLVDKVIRVSEARPHPGTQKKVFDYKKKKGGQDSSTSPSKRPAGNKKRP